MIEEVASTGHGCSVSQASADMIADVITGERPSKRHYVSATVH